MIERKIVITGCGNCPYRDYKIGSNYEYGHYICNKYNFRVDTNTAYSEDNTDSRCMLPINIKSENIK